eukprot:gene13429-50807_t
MLGGLAARIAALEGAAASPPPPAPAPYHSPTHRPPPCVEVAALRDAVAALTAERDAAVGAAGRDGAIAALTAERDDALRQVRLLSAAAAAAP